MSIPGKEVKNGVFEFDFMRLPDTRTKWQIFKDNLYDPKEGTILMHTKKEWGRTVLFYCVFYSILALFFAICMKGLLATLREDRPRWLLESSVIGTSPGMGFRPLPVALGNNQLISYDSKNLTTINFWTQEIDTFLKSYHNSSLLPGGGRNQLVCDYDHSPAAGKVCMFDVDNLGPCSYGKGYGFVHSQPCIFIKLNKIIGWVPDYYSSKELPSNMPENLKLHIQSTNFGQINNVWVSCKQSNSRANGTLLEEVKYYPQSQGFPGYYYPYVNQQGYLSPLVAVQFIKFRKNETIGVECQAWAKNIKSGDNSDDRAYRVHYSLRVNV